MKTTARLLLSGEFNDRKRPDLLLDVEFERFGDLHVSVPGVYERDRIEGVFDGVRVNGGLIGWVEKLAKPDRSNGFSSYRYAYVTARDDDEFYGVRWDDREFAHSRADCVAKMIGYGDGYPVARSLAA